MRDLSKCNMLYVLKIKLTF